MTNSSKESSPLNEPSPSNKSSPSKKSSHEIARLCIDKALLEASREGIAERDGLHALLVRLVEVYKDKQGIEDTRQALEFQAENLQGDEDYAFMRP